MNSAHGLYRFVSRYPAIYIPDFEARVSAFILLLLYVCLYFCGRNTLDLVKQLLIF